MEARDEEKGQAPVTSFRWEWMTQDDLKTVASTLEMTILGTVLGTLFIVLWLLWLWCERLGASFHISWWHTTSGHPPLSPSKLHSATIFTVLSTISSIITSSFISSFICPFICYFPVSLSNVMFHSQLFLFILIFISPTTHSFIISPMHLYFIHHSYHSFIATNLPPRSLIEKQWVVVKDRLFNQRLELLFFYSSNIHVIIQISYSPTISSTYSHENTHSIASILWYAFLIL